MSKWFFDLATKSYINSDGERLSQANLTEVRDSYLSEMDDLVDAYADNLESGAWGVGTVETEMRKRLKDSYVAEYVLGKGGRSQMTQSDYGRLGNLLKRQYKYLRAYLDDVAAGNETKGSAGQRMKNFVGSARQAFSRGRGRAFDFELPYHPGDGGTPCHGNCHCHWEIVEDETEWRAYWHATSDKPCAGCEARRNESSPYVQTKELVA